MASKYKLSKFVGRDVLPGDEIAFERIREAFKEKEKPAADEKKTKRKRQKSNKA